MPFYDLKITGQHAIGDGPNNPMQDVTFTRHTDDDHPGDAIADAIRQATSVGGVRVVAITATLRETDAPKRPAHAPPDAEPLLALVNAVETIQHHLDAAGIEDVVKAFEDWHEFSYHGNRPEEWIATAIVFFLRAEFRALHAELSAGRTDGGHKLDTDPELAARVRPIIEGNEDVLLFIDECYLRDSSFVPIRTSAQATAADEACRAWHANVLRDIAWIVGSHISQDRDDVLGIGQGDQERAGRRLRRVLERLAGDVPKGAD